MLCAMLQASSSLPPPLLGLLLVSDLGLFRSEDDSPGPAPSLGVGDLAPMLLPAYWQQRLKRNDGSNRQ